MRLAFACAGLVSICACGSEPIDLGTDVAALEQGGRLHCGMGEAQAALRNLENGFRHWNPQEGVEGHAGLGAWFDCQYRLWAPVNVVTGNQWMFCEDDIFLAGSVILDPVEISFCNFTGQLHCTQDTDCPFHGEGEICVNHRQEVFADLASYTQRAQFGPSGGTLEELALTRTPILPGSDDPDLGPLLGFQDGAILHRDAGLYQSEWQLFFDRAQVSQVTSVIEVVTHEEHLARLAAGTWK